MQTAQRVSQSDRSDNFVFQRSRLAYEFAAEAVKGGRVIEVGCGSGYGTVILSHSAAELTAADKRLPDPEALGDCPHTRLVRMVFPPLEGIPDAGADFAVCLQVIEHVRDDRRMARELLRVLRPGGTLILSTPNAPMSLTRNPWHVREYTPETLSALLEDAGFEITRRLGVSGDSDVMRYYELNRESVARFRRLDPLDLEHRLPGWALRLPYDLANRINRLRLLRKNISLTEGIGTDDYRIGPVSEDCFDLLFTARRP